MEHKSFVCQLRNLHNICEILSVEQHPGVLVYNLDDYEHALHHFQKGVPNCGATVEGGFKCCLLTL